MLKCATFDLDDTLWAVDPVIRQANQNLWQWLEENGGAFTRLHSPADLVEGSQVRAQLLAEQPEIAHSMTLVRLRLLERGLQAAGFAPPGGAGAGRRRRFRCSCGRVMRWSCSSMRSTCSSSSGLRG